ncbi:MAG: prephenate dehydratase [Chitinispirillaceae bacterium]
MTVVFAGEKGSFSELAALEYFGKSVEVDGVPEFEDVFRKVKRGKYIFGIIPIENSLAGSIHQNYDLLLESKLHIAGEVYLRINHYLLSNKGVALKKIKRVFSHPQALAQCRNFLKRFPRGSLVPVSNTALAVKKIKDEGLEDAGAVASMQAAIDYDMSVLASEIEDNIYNTTRFLIVCRKPPQPINGPKKTSVVFSMKNMPGALFKALSVFALRDVDLFKIESRPVHGKGFDYLFYLDCMGDIRDTALKNAVSHLKEITTFYRLLGSYNVGREIQPKYKGRRRTRNKKVP